MKDNDSGMPDEKYWNTLFDVTRIVEWIGLGESEKPVIEIGCGYGTFSVPVASRIRGTLVCYDIEPDMLNTTKKNIDAQGHANYRLVHRDVVEDGIAQDDDSASAVLLFNILHFAERRTLLREAMRVIEPDGTIAVIHWRKDIATPRGPSLDVRPTADDIIRDAEALGLSVADRETILEPYHWGITLTKRS